MKTVVIANSVGIDKNGLAIIHSPSRWTNSSKDKNVFTYYPWQLAYTSSLLKRDSDCRVVFIDGCLHKLNAEQLAERIIIEKPDYLLMEPATRTWPDDQDVLRQVKAECGASIIVAGQHAMAFPEIVSEIADYVLIGEYEFTVLDIVQGKQRDDIPGLFGNPRRDLLNVDDLPWPEDEDVSRLSYGLPGEPSSEYLEVQAYASRGCPMSCKFCVARHMYYAKPNWRPRNPADVAEELLYLKKKYPQMEGVFFDEEVHNTTKKFILELCEEIKKRDLQSLKIDAMCTYYSMDEEMLDAMKSAGYYLLRVGIETAGENAAKGIDLGVKFDIEKLKRVLRYARKIDMKMYGTFTFGAPGSTPEDDRQTLELMDDIIREGLLWKFQTSICTPQPGTPFFEWAKGKGFVKTECESDFDGGNNVVLEYPGYSSEEIMRNYLEAQKFFDLSLKEKVVRKIEDSLEYIKDKGVDRLLVVRSSRFAQVEAMLKKVRELNPKIEITLLVQKSVVDQAQKMKSDNMLDAVITTDAAFLSDESIEACVKESIDTGDFDMGICLYNNLMGNGYESVEKFLSERKLRFWGAINSEGVFFSGENIQRRREIIANIKGSVS